MSTVEGRNPGAILGEAAKPPFAVLPDPRSLFLLRSKRLESLAVDHPLQPYLRFLAVLRRAQHDIQPHLPAAALPSPDRIALALQHGMPPISRTGYEPDDLVDETITRLVARLADADVPTQTAAAVKVVSSASRDERRAMASGVLQDLAPADDAIAQQALIAAGLQVHFTRLVGLLAAKDLKPIADAACPVCGGGAMTSAIVGWLKVHNTRFCTCSLCATTWNVLRVKCVLCGSTDTLSYRGIDDKPDTIKAETCAKCRGYVKVLYRVNDPALEPLADDVATLGLDIMLAEDGWKRGTQNPFLTGY